MYLSLVSHSKKNFFVYNKFMSGRFRRAERDGGYPGGGRPLRSAALTSAAVVRPPTGREPAAAKARLVQGRRPSHDMVPPGLPHRLFITGP